MSGFEAINEEMSTLAREIEILSSQLEDKRTEYEQCKHNFELIHSDFIMSGKIEHPEWTQTDLLAYAVKQTSNVKLQMILAHGAYRKLRAELSAKRESLDIIKERGWNLRQELRELRS
jgi:septation ring formation regulator EzrA